VARLARLSFSLPCANGEREEAKAGIMKSLKKFIVAVIASSVLAVGATAVEPQKGNEKPPPPPKENREVPRPPKESPPPRDNNNGNKGNNDGKRGGKP
jgi:hypothetical protein